jgi:hypothetical protein
MSFAHAVSTDTWTGTAGDGLFSTAGNWSGSTVPVTGDIIEFLPLATGSNYQAVQLTNDLSGVSFGGVIQGSTSSGFPTYFDIDTIDFAAGASITQDTSGGAKQAYIQLHKSASPYTGTLNAAGDLNIGTGVQIYGGILNVTGNVTGSGTIDPSAGSAISGNITARAALIPSSVTVGGSITLLDNAWGLGFANTGGTIANDITVGTFDSTTYLNQLAFGNCATQLSGGSGGGGADFYYIGCATYANATYNLTGTLNLNANLLIDVAQNSTVNINGTINYNGHTITLAQHSQGALNIGSTAVTTPDITTALSDSQPATNYTIQNKETATLDGSRGFIQVNAGGILLGNGTATYISVQNGGTVAPGHSPGKLTSTTGLFLGPGSTYQAQLQTSVAGGYDQIVVGTASDSSTDVSIDPAAILDTSLYTGYNIKQGDQFMIIDDLGQAAVSGTFAGLAEGAQFTVSGITFSISYVGGDGNDVVLTALNTGKDPGTPNTGAQMLKLANPVVLIGLGVVAAGVLFALARRRTN